MKKLDRPQPDREKIADSIGELYVGKHKWHDRDGFSDRHEFEPLVFNCADQTLALIDRYDYVGQSREERIKDSCMASSIVEGLVEEARKQLASKVEAAKERWLEAGKLLGAKEERELLKKAVSLIKSWHNMPGGGQLSDEQLETAWRIYYDNAPEMAEIRQALKDS